MARCRLFPARAQLAANAPSAVFTIPGCRCRSEQRIAAGGGNTDAGVAAGRRTWLERRLDGKRQHTVAEIAEAVGVHRTRPRNHRWAVPGIVPHHAFHDGSTEPIPVRQPTWPGARTAFPSGRAGAMTDGRPVKTACGVVSLRRPCPDQVPGDRRSASSCPASQPSRRDSGYPAVGAVQLPRSPRRRWSGRTAPRRTGA